MTFARARPGSWAFGEVLTAAQMNHLDIDHVASLDGSATTGGGTYSPVGRLTWRNTWTFDGDNLPVSGLEVMVDVIGSSAFNSGSNAVSAVTALGHSNAGAGEAGAGVQATGGTAGAIAGGSGVVGEGGTSSTSDGGPGVVGVGGEPSTTGAAGVAIDGRGRDAAVSTQTPGDGGLFQGGDGVLGGGARGLATVGGVGTSTGAGGSGLLGTGGAADLADSSAVGGSGVSGQGGAGYTAGPGGYFVGGTADGNNAAADSHGVVGIGGMRDAAVAFSPGLGGEFTGAAGAVASGQTGGIGARGTGGVGAASESGGTGISGQGGAAGAGGDGSFGGTFTNGNISGGTDEAASIALVANGDAAHIDFGVLSGQPTLMGSRHNGRLRANDGQLYYGWLVDATLSKSRWLPLAPIAMFNGYISGGNGGGNDSATMVVNKSVNIQDISNGISTNFAVTFEETMPAFIGDDYLVTINYQDAVATNGSTRLPNTYFPYVFGKSTTGFGFKIIDVASGAVLDLEAASSAFDYGFDIVVSAPPDIGA